MAETGFAGRHLVLIGLRASGKSTAGRLAAARLGVGFVDLDERTLRKAGRMHEGGSFDRVSQAWAELGEAGFRAAEAEALAEALRADQDDVLALGGGTPAYAPSAAVLAEAVDAQVVLGPVYLHAMPGVLADRLARDPGDRPSLTGAHPAEEVAELYARRDGPYRSLARATVEVGRADVEAVARRLEALWRRWAGG
ncbi:MAG: shikimate kinase [Phycisphaerales bacterium]|nr:MAG: shikimate kinase [Phycisphaerales bacterium]